MSPRRRIGEMERAAIFKSAKGRCHICGERIDGGRESWEVEHVIPLELGGDEAKGSSNLQPAHGRDCHPAKTRQDKADIARAQRNARRHMGIKRQPKSPLPGSKASRWKRKLDGTIVPRAILAACLLLALPAEAHEDRYTAKIRSAYDGDTVRADIDLGLGVVMRNETLRLYGIDAPEMRGPEREAGIVSRDWLRARILNHYVQIETHGRGKYGRLLATIYHDGENVNALLVERGLAEVYE